MMLVFPVPKSPMTRTLYKCSCLPAVAYVWERDSGRRERDGGRRRERDGGSRRERGRGG